MKAKKFLAGIVSIAMMGGLVACSSTSFSDEISVSDAAVQDNNSFDTLSSKDDLADKVKEIYTTDYSSKVNENIEELKESDDYDQDNMLIIHNPYGTNTLSLYVYFNSDKACKTSYTISAKDTEDFSETVESSYTKEHEFQVIGLVPSVKNTITFTFEYKDGTTETKEVTYKMGDLLGSEETQLEVTEDSGNTEQLSNGLYVVLGNDSDDQDFMYYYDNNGQIRGEVPIIGYRSHRLLFKDNCMYYSISEHKIAVVDSLGQVQKILSTGDYELHHDYAFDDDGNLLVLASYEGDSYKDSRSEDLVIKLDVESGEVTGELDLGDVFSDYKENFAERPEDDENSEGVFGMDWIHINTIQYVSDDDSLILSSRETSTIIKLSDAFSDSPKIDYLIGEESFWQDTEYADKVLTKEGDFATATGQHSVTYEKDDSLEDGQYYLYMFNNNFGSSATNTKYDWSQIDGTNLVGNYGMTEDQLANARSYFYKYLVDENAGTYSLVESFEVPYSAYVSSVQEIDGNVIADSGFQGLWGEYTSDGTLLKQFKMKLNKYMVYRVYKYTFDGFYFNK